METRGEGTQLQPALQVGAVMAGAASGLSSSPCADNTFSFGFIAVDLRCTQPSILTGAHNLSFGLQSTCMGWGCILHFSDEETETQGYSLTTGSSEVRPGFDGQD